MGLVARTVRLVAQWSLTFSTSVALLCAEMVTLMMYAELLNDHINPIELCDRLNVLRRPRIGALVLQVVILLAGGHWIVAALYLPWLAYEVYGELGNGTSNQRLDSTNIFVKLPDKQRESHGRTAMAAVLFAAELVA